MQKQPDGYFVPSATGPGPGVLVLHAWWGLNDTIKAICDRLAQAGYTVFAPDLYHGKIAATIPEAEALGKKVDENEQQTRAEIAEAARYLEARAGSDGSGLALLSFSLGGYFALDLAASEPERAKAVVLFYGSGGGDFSRSRAAYLGHFAENDPYEPAEYVDELEAELRKTGRPVTFYRYPGTGHWFFEPDRPEAYNEEAANLAWERTLAFLRETMQAG